MRSPRGGGAAAHRLPARGSQGRRGWCSASRSIATSASRTSARSRSFGVMRRRRERRGGDAGDCRSAHPDAGTVAAGGEPERRQSAEGRAGEVAGGARRHLHLRRTDARHRRGGASRHLRADELAGRIGRRRDHDLVGSAGGARHERPRAGDARRRRRGRASPPAKRPKRACCRRRSGWPRDSAARGPARQPSARDARRPGGAEPVAVGAQRRTS